MKEGNFLLKESTRVSISLATFIIVIVAVVGFGYTLGVVRSQMAASDERIEQMVIVETDQRKQDIKLVNDRLDEVQPLLLENQKDMASIMTDLEWLKATQIQILEKLK